RSAPLHTSLPQRPGPIGQPLTLDRRRVLSGMAAAPLVMGAGTSPAAFASETQSGLGTQILEASRHLLGRDGALFDRALSTLTDYGKPDNAPTLILALRFSWADRDAIAAVLRDVTGHQAGTDWFDWMLWQERNPQIVPHPSFTTVKRDVFLRIDPNFDVFLKPAFLERDRMDIRFEEIAWGGVEKDGIPSLDNPKLVAADEADYLHGDDLIFGVSINGDQRAYPLRIMGWHEMFNETIGGVPLALAYCTLCGSGILFETAVEGREVPFVFGSSGFLYRSNKLMFDRETHSLWNQFTGEPVVGPLAGSGLALKQRPVTIEAWSRWKARNPQTRVLSLDTGHVRNYGSGVVYRDYFASPALMFPTVTDETRLRQKDYVFGVRTVGASKAWPLNAFKGERVLNDSVGRLPLVLIGEADGRTVRAYERGDHEFQRGRFGRGLVAGGQAWEMTEEALIGPGGERAPRVAGHVAYWFAWDGYLGLRSELYTE
ncbi:MAG: DUF3179 domain-containing protein, partial [Pseudomonadota bacterium]